MSRIIYQRKVKKPPAPKNYGLHCPLCGAGFITDDEEIENKEVDCPNCHRPIAFNWINRAMFYWYCYWDYIND